jgi:RNA polymerase sigma-70 factor (ECF subfamily)
MRAVIEAALARRQCHATAARWGLSAARVADAIEASLHRLCGAADPAPAEIDRAVDALHLDDLVLACACAEGLDAAWEHFIREYRPTLYRAADAIDPSGSARDLADGIYAELFGLAERDGERRSHFRYYHGRSSLGTWLRAVLAQRHVDRIRATRRLDSLPPDESAVALPAPSHGDVPDRPRYLTAMRVAVAAAVSALPARDRLRLTCYYAQNLTLAEIGRAVSEHEATVSRHLTRTRRAVRAHVERHLRETDGMTDAQMRECFTSVAEDAGPLRLEHMLGTASADGGAGTADVERSAIEQSGVQESAIQERSVRKKTADGRSR